MTFIGVTYPGRYTPNAEGLTWTEWAAAAGLPFSDLRYELYHPVLPAWRAERRAWRNGEDPTDWRKVPQKTY